MIHPNLKLLSQSSQVLEEACPRRYELDRLSERMEKEEDIHLDFGTVVGDLVQHYMVTDSVDDAVFQMFMRWPRELFTESQEEEKNKKNFWYALYALDRFVPLRKSVLDEYEVAAFNGKPAKELGFVIDCGDGFKYRGKLDLLLVSKKTQRFACMEIKTTNSTRLHPAMYQNSGQGIGYSAIVDIVASKYGMQQRDAFPVIYPVYQSKQQEWEEFRFTKKKTSTVNWLRHLLRTIQHISEYAEDGFFPMYGQSCFDFFRPCPFFDTCEMDNRFLVGANPALKEDKEGEYQFHFTLDELIAAQLEKQTINRE